MPITAETLTLWAGVICTLAIFSLLYKENPVFRFFEHLFIGVATGYTLSRAWSDILKPKLWFALVGSGEDPGGRWWMFVALLIGLLYYAIYFRRFAWMSRLLIGVMMGFAAGLAFQGIATNYGPQIAGAFNPLLPRPGMTISGLINNWVMTLTLIAVMTYFFFAFEQQNKGVQNTAKVGRWLLMISFGAIFGQTIMARMALATGRLSFLIDFFRDPFGGG
ncbi:MAG: hypothetical protein KY468_03450 [Armatimonadetes bacterium]|nr:hypothetical protein [Armatimonadota bacterium]